MNTRRIRLTAGNINNSHFYLRKDLDFFPADAVGGSNRKNLGVPIQVKFEPGPSALSDIDGDKCILRARGEMRDFFESSAAREGDEVIIERVGDREYLVRLEPEA